MTADAEERLDFKAAVLALDQRCLVHEPGDPDCDVDLQAHHVVTQQQLRRHGLEEWLWSPRVGMTVCVTAHRRHHSRAEPIPRALVPHRCLLFAIEHDLDWLIDRYYPREH